MVTVPTDKRLPSCRSSLALLALVLGSCSAEPEEQFIRGNYSVEYDPLRLVSATGNCDRLISHAVLSMNELGDFDLSVNVVDDCTRAGGGYDFSEVLKLGDYQLEGTRLSFTPDSASTPLFTGMVDGDFIQLSLPPAVGVAIIDVELRVGPRIPF
jgi:hypothetical protein